MLGYKFTRFIPEISSKNSFENLLDLFLQLTIITAGDVSEALNWMNDIDRQYGLTTDEYSMGDFIEDLKDAGYIQDDESGQRLYLLTNKSEQSIRRRSLEEIFTKLHKGNGGQHRTPYSGQGDELTADRREFQFGDTFEQIAFTESLKNSQIHHGIKDFRLTEDDLEIEEREYKTQTSTVLLIDISHSMVLYGEDRITPAKKVALALAELITTQYPKDSLDIIAFGNDAWQIQVKDLPYLQVGPFYTNTVAGLELALDLLRKRKNTNKQIFMITDGKPSCLKEGFKYYKNAFGLDRKIINRTLSLAAKSRKLRIPITTFMIARDPYLQQFIRDFTKLNQGRAYYSSLQNLGEFIFEDYIRNRRKKVR